MEPDCGDEGISGARKLQGMHLKSRKTSSQFAVAQEMEKVIKLTDGRSIFRRSRVPWAELQILIC